MRATNREYRRDWSCVRRWFYRSYLGRVRETLRQSREEDDPRSLEAILSRMPGVIISGWRAGGRHQSFANVRMCDGWYNSWWGGKRDQGHEALRKAIQGVAERCSEVWY